MRASLLEAFFWVPSLPLNLLLQARTCHRSIQWIKRISVGSLCRLWLITILNNLTRCQSSLREALVLIDRSTEVVTIPNQSKTRVNPLEQILKLKKCSNLEKRSLKKVKKLWICLQSHPSQKDRPNLKANKSSIRWVAITSKSRCYRNQQGKPLMILNK